jgi:hypothetical protein
MQKASPCKLHLLLPFVVFVEPTLLRFDVRELNPIRPPVVTAAAKLPKAAGIVVLGRVGRYLSVTPPSHAFRFARRYEEIAPGRFLLRPSALADIGKQRGRCD